jgi:hypothetical protein
MKFKFKCLLCQDDLKSVPDKNKEESYFCCVECFQQAIDVLEFQFKNFPENFNRRLENLGVNEP